MKSLNLMCILLLTMTITIGCASNIKNPDVIYLPAEHETSTIDGLRLNAYVEKKEFKLGDPINIHTLVKNTSNKIKFFSIFSFSSTNEVRLHYAVLNEKGEPVEGFPSSLHHGFDTDQDSLNKVDYSLNPNAVIMFKKDIKELIKKPGRYKIIVRLIAITKTGILTSNEIEFEVVE